MCDFDISTATSIMLLEKQERVGDLESRVLEMLGMLPSTTLS